MKKEKCPVCGTELKATVLCGQVIAFSCDKCDYMREEEQNIKTKEELAIYEVKNRFKWFSEQLNKNPYLKIECDVFFADTITILEERLCSDKKENNIVIYNSSTKELETYIKREKVQMLLDSLNKELDKIYYNNLVIVFNEIKKKLGEEK